MKRSNRLILLIGVVLAIVAWYVGRALWEDNDKGLDQAVILTEVAWVMGFLLGVGAFVAPVRWMLGKDMTHEDEMFLVVKGRFRMEFRDRHEWIEEGEFIVVPRGVEHRPVADEECWLVLFEPATTLNTGNVENERTVHELERV